MSAQPPSGVVQAAGVTPRRGAGVIVGVIGRVATGLISRFIERVSCGVGEAREGEREQASNAVVARDRRVAQPLDERACDARADRRDEVQPVRGQPRAEHGHLDDQRPLPAEPRDLLDHLSVGDDLRAADVEALAERLRPARDAREVADHVGEGDRLGRGRDPSRRDHHREPVDEGDDRLECGTAAADDDGGPQRRHRNGPGREDGAGLGPAPQVCREVGRVIAEPAEIDDLGDARPLGLGRDVLGHPPIELGEVARAERVDEVIGDVDALERAARRFAVGQVRGDRANSRQSDAVARRETATTSPRCASAGTSARPTNPVAPRTAALTAARRRPGRAS